MIPARKFTLADDNDYERLAAASGRLRVLLEALAENQLPTEYGADQLAGYARSILEAQRPDGSFSVSSDPDRLDPDVRSDAHRFVTWAALAFLCRFQSEYPEAAAGLDGLDKGISAGLDSPAAADLTFPESGPAEPVQQIEAVLVLAAGGIPGRLRADTSSGSELKVSLGRLESEFRRRLDIDDTTLPGGIEYKQLFTQALTVLDN